MKNLFIATTSFLLLLSANSFAEKPNSEKENVQSYSADQSKKTAVQKSKGATKKIAHKKANKKSGVKKTTKKEDKSNI